MSDNKVFNEPALQVIEGHSHKSYNTYHTRLPRKVTLNISDYEIKKLMALSGKTYTTPEAILEEFIADITDSEYGTGNTDPALNWFMVEHTPEYPEKNFVTYIHNNNYSTPVIKLVEAYFSCIQCIEEYSEMVYLDKEAQEDKRYYEEEAKDARKQLKQYYDQYKGFNSDVEPFEQSLQLLMDWLTKAKKIKTLQK